MAKKQVTTKIEFAADDGSLHESLEAAEAYERQQKLRPLSGLTVEQILEGIASAKDDVRNAVMVANALVQDVRRKRGMIRHRSRQPSPIAA